MGWTQAPGGKWNRRYECVALTEFMGGASISRSNTLTWDRPATVAEIRLQQFRPNTVTSDGTAAGSSASLAVTSVSATSSDLVSVSLAWV